MPKYRTLTNDEIQHLEKEFIDFLIINGITGEDWERIKRTNESKTNRLIELFSDVIFEKILRDIKFLDHYSPNSIKTFRCDTERIYLVAMDSSDPEYNLSTKEGVNKAKSTPPKDLEIYKTDKEYHPNREAELFRMLSNGCQISNGALYEAILSSLK